MSKELSEMTLEELWQLFPIRLTEHKSEWKSYYDEMKTVLEAVFQDKVSVQINHIGSTAIEGIWAKPIVDILIEADNPKEAAELLEKQGFLLMNSEGDRFSFNSGYTKYGFAEKIYHLHVRKTGDNAEIAFRDYLRRFPAIAKQYESLKLELWKKFEFNRDAYTEAKTEFVSKYTSIASAETENKG